MGKTPATIAAGVCWFLAFLWFVVLCMPMNWIWCENLLLRFRINLFGMKINKGLFTWLGAALLGGVTKSQLIHSVSELFDMDVWLDDGAHRLCSPAVNILWNWCGEVTALKYGSFAMIFFGFLTIAFLSAGGFFMYYYAHEHATYTGRRWALGCLIGAPISSILGVIQYLICTIHLSEAFSQFGLSAGATFMYGPGFFISCMLSLASCVPIYIHYGFNKKSLYEKGDMTHDYDPSLNPGGYGGHGGYGAADGSGACAPGNAWSNQTQCPPPAGQALYGGPAPTVHVTQVQVPLAPQNAQYPQTPGSYQPAW